MKVEQFGLNKKLKIKILFFLNFYFRILIWSIYGSGRKYMRKCFKPKNKVGRGY